MSSSKIVLCRIGFDLENGLFYSSGFTKASPYDGGVAVPATIHTKEPHILSKDFLKDNIMEIVEEILTRESYRLKDTERLFAKLNTDRGVK